MFHPTPKDTMYPITTNRTGYSNTTVLRRNGNAAGENKLTSYNKLLEQSQHIQVYNSSKLLQEPHDQTL